MNSITINLLFVITLIEVQKIIHYFSAIYVCINYGSAFESNFFFFIKYYIKFKVCLKSYELTIQFFLFETAKSILVYLCIMQGLYLH